MIILVRLEIIKALEAKSLIKLIRSKKTTRGEKEAKNFIFGVICFCLLKSILLKSANTSGVSTKIAPSLAKTILTILPKMISNTKNFQV